MIDFSARQRGFTLLEMLVVMILVSLISATLIQAMGYIFDIQQRAGNQTWRMQEKSMSEDWFRQTVEGLQPDDQDGKNKFMGDDHQFSGLTTNSLTENYGGLSPFSFSLHHDYQSGSTRLAYGAKDDDPAILFWNDEAIKFVYIDAKGDPHDSWPPALGLWPQLPSLIRLEGTKFTLVAAPSGPMEPLPRVQDVMGIVP